MIPLELGARALMGNAHEFELYDSRIIADDIQIDLTVTDSETEITIINFDTISFPHPHLSFGKSHALVQMPLLHALEIMK